MKKRPFSPFAQVMNAATKVMPGRDKPHGLLQTMQALVKCELQRIGFTNEEIDYFTHNQEVPPYGMIQDRTINFDITRSPFYPDGEDENWGPLTVDSYYSALRLLSQYNIVLEAAIENDYKGRNLLPHQWVSMGLTLGWELMNVSLSTIAELTRSVDSELRAEQRTGKTYSVAREAITELVKNGRSTGKAVREYLENNDSISGTNITVSRESDKWGKTTSYIFFDEGTARTAKLSIQSLAPTVSGIKART